MSDESDDVADAEEAREAAESRLFKAQQAATQSAGLVYMPGVPTLAELAGGGGAEPDALSTAPKVPEPTSPLEYAEAAGAGALRGASFGTSDPALVHSGLTTSEKLRELKEKAPITSGAFEVGGNVASVLGAEALTGGAATPELAAAEVAGKGAAGAIGEAAAKQALIGSVMGAGNKLSEDTLGDKETTAESLLASGLMGGIVGGGAGALVGAASRGAQPVLDSIAEKTGKLGDSLKAFAESHGADPRASLENGVGELTDNLQDVADVQAKTGKLFHGADQDGLRYQEQDQLTKALDPAKVQDAANAALDDIAGPSKAKIAAKTGIEAAKVANREAGAAAEEVETEPQQPKSLVQTMTDDRLVEPRVSGKASDILTGLREDLETAENPSEVMSAVRDTRRQLRDLKDALGGTTDVGKNTALGYITDIDQSLKNHLENPEIYGAAGVRESAVNQSIAKEMDATKGIIDAGLGKKVVTKGQPGFDVEIKPSAVRSLARDMVAGKPEAAAKLEAINSWVDAIKGKGEQISQSAANLPTSESAGDLKTLLLQQAKQMAEVSGNTAKVQQLQEALQAAKPSSGIIQGFLARHIGDKAAEIATHPVEGLSTLADMVKATTKVTNQINRGVSAFLATNLAQKAAPISISHTLETASWSGKRQNAKEDRLAGYQARTKEWQAMAANPAALTNQIVGRTGKIHAAAPVTSGLIAMKAAGALSHLTNTMGPPQTSQDLIGNHQPKQAPSEAQMSKLEQTHRVIKKPLSVLDSMRQGTLSSNEISTLKTVYPKLYQQMASSLVTKLASSREPVPYANRLQISAFLGQPADSSLLPQNFAMLQSNYANDMTQEKTPPMTGKRKQNSARVADMGLAESEQTPFQKVGGA
jgi:hypothetical protein